MNASDFLDITAMERMIREGYVSRRRHPEAALDIYNYTNRCQYDAQVLMGDARVDRNSRKTTAEFFKAQPFPSVLFSLLDGKDPAQQIWKLVKPEFERPYVTAETGQ